MSESLSKLLEEDLSIYKGTKNMGPCGKKTLCFLFFFAYKSFRAILLYRISHHFLIHNKKKRYIFSEFMKNMFSPIEISSDTIIGPKIHFPHPQCIVIGGGVIGKNVYIYQGVTIGVKKKGDNYATIEDNVLLSAGSKILGEVHLGKNSKIGANAVVIDDVLSESVVGGIPAKIIKRNDGK